MPWVETNRANVVSRLEGEGWVCEGGGKHDKFSHPTRSGKIAVPRHRILTTGVARDIAKKAGWL